MLDSISNIVPAVVWTLASGFILTGGDIMLRSWFQTKWSYGFEVAFVTYALGLLCMMMSFFQQNIAIATVAAVVINVVGYLLIAHAIYGDTIRFWQIAGVILGLVAFAILELA